MSVHNRFHRRVIAYRFSIMAALSNVAAVAANPIKQSLHNLPAPTPAPDAQQSQQSSKITRPLSVLIAISVFVILLAHIARYLTHCHFRFYHICIVLLLTWKFFTVVQGLVLVVLGSIFENLEAVGIGAASVAWIFNQAETSWNAFVNLFHLLHHIPSPSLIPPHNRCDYCRVINNLIDTAIQPE